MISRAEPENTLGNTTPRCQIMRKLKKQKNKAAIEWDRYTGYFYSTVQYYGVDEYELSWLDVRRNAISLRPAPLRKFKNYIIIRFFLYDA